MDFLDRDTESRKSFRCRASVSDGRAELQIGQRRIPVQLRDESAGGFAVIAVECPEVKRSDVMQLHLDSRVFNVCLIHLFEDESPAPGRGGRIYRIGLQRLGETMEPPKADPPYRSLLSAVFRGLFPSARTLSTPSGLVLAVVVVAAPLVFAAIFYYFYRTTPAAPAGGWARTGDANAADRTQAAGAASQTSSGASDWATIARLPGASALLASPVIHELGLTEKQQRRIGEIVDQTAEAFKQLDLQFGGASRQEQSRMERRLLKAAREEALGLLTPEQRRQFQVALDKVREP